MVVACVAMAEYSVGRENDYGENGQLPSMELSSTKVLPLNSKRVTNQHLKLICEALALTTTGSGDQMSQLIEGKLCSEEYGREPANIQVLVNESHLVEVKLSLLDEGDVFLDTSPITRASDVALLQALSQENETLKEDLLKVTDLLAAEMGLTATLRADLSSHDKVDDAREEVACLKEQLEQEKLKNKRMWQISCQQSREHRYQTLCQFQCMNNLTRLWSCQ